MSGSIARLIDHSLLHPTLTAPEVAAGCRLALEYGVASVCAKPCDVALAAEILVGTPVAVGTVIGFPHGSAATETKLFEARLACSQGAVELDMVVNVARVLSHDWLLIEEEIRAIVTQAHEFGAITKVIFENDFLPDDALKIRLCEICTFAGAEFAKTSTGFGFVKGADGRYDYRGATEHDVALMRAHCGQGVQIKAAGGIRTYAQAQRMRELGCTRIGATATAEIVAGERAQRG
ncbi:MAG: deoxyribose-phosphate aldolase [Pirellulales bacterium]|nr:deoxyribose-phosphate aldolase [Pirellulales bacterium]